MSTPNKNTAPLRSFDRLTQPWTAAAIVFLLSVVVASAFLSLLPDSYRSLEFSDYTNFYEPVARNILAGRGITISGGAIATTWGPGFPIILSVLFAAADRLHLSEDGVLLTFMFICNGLTAVFIFMMARRLWPPLPALVAALLWITYPFNLWFMQHPSSEHPFMVLLSGSLCLFWLARARGWGGGSLALCGVLLGLAALIRPIGIGLGAILGVLAWFFSREHGTQARIASVLAVMLAFIVVVLPWVIWVHAMTGQWIPIASSGSASALSGLTYALERGYRADTVPSEFVALQRRILDSRPKSPGEIGAVLLAELGHDPRTASAFLLLKLARSWYGTYSGQFESVAAVVQIPYLVLILFGLWCARRLPRPAQWMAAAHWLIVVYFWAMSTLVVSNLRYMAPVMGLVLIFIPGLICAARLSFAD